MNDRTNLHLLIANRLVWNDPMPSVSPVKAHFSPSYMQLNFEVVPNQIARRWTIFATIVKALETTLLEKVDLHATCGLKVAKNSKLPSVIALGRHRSSDGLTEASKPEVLT